MRFGYCTGFAAGMTGSVCESLLTDIQQCGYDYVEFPLMQIEALSQETFEELASRLSDMHLSCEVMCNFFPAHVRLLGSEAKEQTIRRYLDNAFLRMQRLGTRKIVFGSSGARKLSDGMSKQEGVAQLCALMKQMVVPYLEAFDVLLVMEPIGSYEANFIHTLPDGMEIVHRVNHPRVQLLADSVHLLYENEPPEHIVQYAKHLRHIHICEEERALPVEALSNRLQAIVEALVQIGYDETLSFESMPYAPENMQAALKTIKAALHKG